MNGVGIKRMLHLAFLKSNKFRSILCVPLCAYSLFTFYSKCRNAMVFLQIMFLLVVKFDTWYIHAPAREQIREALLEFIWPDLPELHAFFREHFTLFIDMRIRHFRDSVARYFRDRPRSDVKANGVNSANQTKQFKGKVIYVEQ